MNTHRRHEALLGFAAALLALGVFLGLTGWVLVRGSSLASEANQMICRSGRCCCAGASKDKVTLNPLLFIGPVRQAYIIAQQKPALLAQLHCYCGCDLVYGHKNLLDCYRDRHGSRCDICVGEAIEANRLDEQRSPVEQIRDALRRFDRRQ